MTALATEIREDLVAALTPIGVPVVSPAPDVPVPPMIAVTPGTPWATVETGTGVTYRMRVMVVTRYADEHFTQLEDLVQDALLSLPAGWVVDTVTAPAQLDTGAQGVVQVSEILVLATFAWPTPTQ